MGQFSEIVGPILKKSRLERQVSKWKNRAAREKAKRERDLAEARVWTAISMQVCARDRQTCRVCFRLTLPYGVTTGDPRKFGQSHHIVYRSAGGPDTLDNLVWICNACSSKEHDEHRYVITGTADLLSITERNPETGKTIESWESRPASDTGSTQEQA